MLSDNTEYVRVPSRQQTDNSFYLSKVSETFVQDSQTGTINENPMDTTDIAPFRYRNETIAPLIPLLQAQTTTTTTTTTKPTSGNASDKVGQLEPSSNSSSSSQRPISIIKKSQIPPPKIRLTSPEYTDIDAQTASRPTSIVIEDYSQQIKPKRNTNTHSSGNIIVSPNSSETLSSSELNNIDSNEESGNDIIDDDNIEYYNQPTQPQQQQQQTQLQYDIRNLLINNEEIAKRASTLPKNTASAVPQNVDITSKNGNSFKETKAKKNIFGSLFKSKKKGKYDVPPTKSNDKK
jgi:hypothetical protein